MRVWKIWYRKRADLSISSQYVSIHRDCQQLSAVHQEPPRLLFMSSWLTVGDTYTAVAQLKSWGATFFGNEEKPEACIHIKNSMFSTLTGLWEFFKSTLASIPFPDFLLESKIWGIQNFQKFLRWFQCDANSEKSSWKAVKFLGSQCMFWSWHPWMPFP